MGITISKSVDDYLNLTYKQAPMKFLKNLLIRGGFFTLQELASHSLKGGKGPRSSGDVRPALDSGKLKPAIGIYFWLWMN